LELENISGLYEVRGSGVDFTSPGGKSVTRGDATFTVPETGHLLAIRV